MAVAREAATAAVRGVEDRTEVGGEVEAGSREVGVTEVQAALCNAVAPAPVLVVSAVVLVLVLVVVVGAAKVAHREVIRDLSTEDTRPLPSLVRHWGFPLLHCKRALLLHSARGDSC